MTQEERDVVSHVRSKVEEARSSASRIAHEGIWMTNVAYVLGYDGIAFNSMTRQFQPVNRASAYLKKNRLHCNKILPTIQNRLARLCKNPPKYDVRPETNDADSKDAARFALQVLMNQWDTLGLNEKRIVLMMWVQQLGHSYMKISWDPSLGDPLPEDIAPGQYMGDIRAEVVSAFEVFPNPGAKTWEEVERSWLTQCKVRTLDYFKMQYPERGGLVKEEEAWLLSAQYEQRIQSLNSRGPAQGGMDGRMKNSAIEMIKYEARSPGHPNGRMICCANGILLRDDELPCGEIPFAKFDDVVIGGKYFSEAVVTHLRPIQDQFNETIRKRAEWTRKLLAGKYHAFRGSNLQQESLNDESGEVVYTDVVPNAPDGGKPTPIQTPTIPTYAYNEEDRLTQQLNDISGISEVSRGTMPSASIPAIGMQLLTEQDDTRIGVMTEQHEHAWARVGKLILKNVETNYKLERKIKMAGKGMEYAVRDYSGEALKGHTDVIVVRGSTLPGSKFLRNQEIINRYNMGFLGPVGDPRTIEKVNAMTEFGDTSEVFHDYGLDMAQIKRGIDALEQGKPVTAHELDNHVLWMQELNRYRKGDRFDSLDPAIQQAFENMIEAHITLQKKALNMTPPPPPPPPPELAANMPGEAPPDQPGENLTPGAP